MFDVKKPILKIALSAFAVILPLFFTGERAGAEDKVIRVAVQRSSILMSILKGQGTLEKALAPLGVTVQWNEFTSGLPMVEALNVGALDITCDMGDTVPLFAQAAKTNFAYFLQEDPSPTAEAIVVPKDSPIKTVADLKGKKIAMPKASGAQYLVIAALTTAGLDFNKDIEAVYLQPAESRTAFETGAIDAWATWEPYLSILDFQSNVKHVIDGSGCNAPYRRFFLASNDFLNNNPKTVKVIVDELANTVKWIRANEDQAAQLLAPILKQDVNVIKQANSRRSLYLKTISEDALVSQQAIADAFVKLGLLKDAINVRDNKIWVPSKNQK